LSTLPLRRPLGRDLTGHVIVAPGRRGKPDEGKRFLTKEIKDWESSKAPDMTLRAELLLIATLIAASLILGHILEGTGLGTVIQ
jgi:hypothetical protein